MGGGDLNSKKSWHPNILKNQERVWKAEQAVAEEKKRIQELQRERQQERDKMELQSLVKQNFANADDKRLDWMYEKPNKAVQSEDYLLGKSIEKNHQADKNDSEGIPAVTKRVVGSSMLTAPDDSQVDVARKLREDPLLMIKERERAARAALLNNPLHRRRIAELLRKEQDSKKPKDKKPKNKSKNLDAELAAKLSALSGDKNIDLASLLEASDSSSDSSTDKESKKKKKKKKKAKKKKSSKKKKETNNSSESDDNRASAKVHNKKRDQFDREIRNREETSDHKSQARKNTQEHELSRSHKRKSDQDVHYSEKSTKRRRNDDKHDRRRSDSESSTHRRRINDERNRDSQYSSRRKYDKDETSNTNTKLNEQERAARLAEMAAAGSQREIERGKRVAEQRLDDEREVKSHRGTWRNEARALPDSVESRIHSNRHYIQRGSRHMNEHFARR